MFQTDIYCLVTSGPGSSLRGNYRKGVIIGGANHNGGSTSYGGRGMGRGEEGSNYNRGVSNHDGHEFLKTLAQGELFQQTII